jgi:hypothetical protein
VELLEKCVTMLEEDDQPDLARRIMQRYTMESFSGTESWRTWLDTNRDRLFFTDTGGYKFLVAPEVPTQPAIRPEPRSPAVR